MGEKRHGHDLAKVGTPIAAQVPKIEEESGAGV